MPFYTVHTNDTSNLSKAHATRDSSGLATLAISVGQRVLKFESHVTIGLGICGFLLVVHWNHVSILYRYGDIGPQRYWGHDLDLLGSGDVIDHVTIGLGMGTFLLVVNDDHAPILHEYRDTGVQKLWGHEFDLLRSRDVISHVTIGLGICGFLLVVHWNHASILHRYVNIKPQICICPCERPKANTNPNPKT